MSFICSFITLSYFYECAPLEPKAVEKYAKDVMAALKDHKQEVYVHQVHHKESLGEFKGSKYLFSVDSSETISADFDASLSLKGKNGIVSGSFGIARDGVGLKFDMDAAALDILGPQIDYELNEPIHMNTLDA
jgi:hypothetical protein